jgi:type IV secretory pathway VirB9-like protein
MFTLSEYRNKPQNLADFLPWAAQRFIIGTDGKTSELVKYRVRNSHMIVERMFAAAEFRLGDKGSERRVRVARNDGRLTW